MVNTLKLPVGIDSFEKIQMCIRDRDMTEFISTGSMPLAIVFLIAGFFLLVKGADVFVEGSSSICLLYTSVLFYIWNRKNVLNPV